MTVGAATQLAPRHHLVQFYEHDDELVSVVADFLAEALSDLDSVIVVATAEHTRLFEAAIAASGIDVARARATHRLVTLDAAETLAHFMVDGKPDARAFDKTVGEIVRAATRNGRRVRAYGEMVALLWNDGNVTGAMQLEGLWNDLGAEIPFALLCAYPASSVSGAHNVEALAGVCHLHSAVLGKEPVVMRRSEELLTAVAGRTRRFAATLTAPGAARQFVVDTLSAWNRADLLDDARLIVTELATNAVAHARTEFTVTVTRQQDTIRIAVHDGKTTAPRLQHAGWLAESGRGLALVSEIAHRWGQDEQGDGKTVWAELLPRASTAKAVDADDRHH
jgi:anti-sigma regulatory factor (Ser/Thr protein kinase)